MSDSLAIAVLFFFFGIISLIGAISLILRTRNGTTNAYRGFLNDLLIAGKLRQLAAREKVDIKTEIMNYLEYVKFMKKLNARNQDTIQENIQYKIKERINEELNSDIKSK